MPKTTIQLFILLMIGTVLVLPAAAQVPAPESVFGFKAGADMRLATYDQAIAYFKKLAESSPFLKLVEAGKTSQGRTAYFALISNPENLTRLDRTDTAARQLKAQALRQLGFRQMNINWRNFYLRRRV